MSTMVSIIDLYDRSVAASLNSGYINTELAVDTLKRAIKNENPGAGLILHSDQGCQFTSWTFVDFCKSQGIIQSMSKAGALMIMLLWSGFIKHLRMNWYIGIIDFLLDDSLF